MSHHVQASRPGVKTDSRFCFNDLPTFATAEAMKTWLPPQGMTATMLAFTFREGGIYRMRLTYDEPQHTPGKTSEDADEVEV